MTAVFAFVALSATSASATVVTLLALWLWKGVAIAEPLNIEAEGELLLEDTKGGLFGEAVDVLCSGILDGTANPESLDYVSEVLTLTPTIKELINTEPLVELGLECINNTGCPTPLVWAENLPWETEVKLVEIGTLVDFAIYIYGNPGWLVQCMGVIGEPEDLCETPIGVALLLLNAGGTELLAEFNEAFRNEVGLLKANCTRGGTGAGVAESDAQGPIKHETGGELSVSSDGIEA
jgi:hypothetical protein